MKLSAQRLYHTGETQVVVWSHANVPWPQRPQDPRILLALPATFIGRFPETRPRRGQLLRSHLDVVFPEDWMPVNCYHVLADLYLQTKSAPAPPEFWSIQDGSGIVQLRFQPAFAAEWRDELVHLARHIILP